MRSRNSEPGKYIDKSPLLFVDNLSPISNISEHHGTYRDTEISSIDDKLDRKFFVEVSNGGKAGSISAVLQNSKTAEIRDFYVIEDAEDSGLRDKLLEKAEKYCRKKKVEKMQAKIFPDMKQYFKSRGFKIEKRLKDHFQRGEDILVVSKILRRK